MARILSDETSLARTRDHLARESRVLTVLRYVELAAAAALLLAGATVYFLKGSTGLLTVAGIVRRALAVLSR